MARINLGVKPYSSMQPVWIIATYDESGKPDAMNAAWGGISESDEITVCLSRDHKTCENFLRTGAFSVSMATADYLVSCDYVGIVSANREPDKFEKAGFTHTRSSFVNAPVINELPICLECRVRSFEGEILKGEIVNVSVDENVLTSGKVDITKARTIAFDPFTNSYFEVGKRVGSAFKDGLALKK